MFLRVTYHNIGIIDTYDLSELGCVQATQVAYRAKNQLTSVILFIGQEGFRLGSDNQWVPTDGLRTDNWEI